MTNRNFEFASTSSDDFSLHDCWATSAESSDGKLTFFFSDGIFCEEYGREWPNTGEAAVEFATDSAVFHWFEEADERTIRKTLAIERLVEKIGAGDWELEFAYRYDGFNETLFTCWFWHRATQRSYEAQLFIGTTDMTYRWNSLHA